MNNSALMMKMSSTSLDNVTYIEMLGCGLELNTDELNTVLIYRYSLVDHSPSLYLLSFKSLKHVPHPR